MIHSRSRYFRLSWRKVCATVRANRTAMMTRNVQRSWTKPDRSLRPTASKNWPFHSLSRTCPNMLAMVTAIEATKIATTRRPPSARRSTRANKAQVAGKIEILQLARLDEFVRERGSGSRDRYYRYCRLCGRRHPRRSLRRRVCGKRRKGGCNVRLHLLVYACFGHGITGLELRRPPASQPFRRQ